MSSQIACHTTYNYKLQPTPEQERELERVVMLCRQLDYTTLEQRITAWQRCRVSVTHFEQEAELKDIRAEFAEYAAIHSHVLQDVLALGQDLPGVLSSGAAGRESGLSAL